MVELKIRRFSNLLGVILPKEVIDRLRVKEGETLFLTEAPDGGYQLTSGDPPCEERFGESGRHHQSLLRQVAGIGQVTVMQEGASPVFFRITKAG